MTSDSELINTIKALNNNIVTLNSNIEILSSKYVTPSDISDVITGFSTKFGLVDIGDTDEWTGTGLTNNVCYDGSEWYYYIGSGEIYKAKPSGGAATSIYTYAGSGYMIGLAYDRDNDYIYFGDNDDGTYDAKIHTIDTIGTLLDTQTLVNPVMPPANYNINGLAYDYDNSKLYVMYYGPAFDPVRYAIIDPTTGMTSSRVDLTWKHYQILGMAYLDGLLYFSFDPALFPQESLIGYRLSDSLPVFSGKCSVTSTYQYFTIDDTQKLFLFAKANAFEMNIMAPITRVSIYDDGGTTVSIDDGGGTISVDDGAGSLTVDGSVTATMIVAPSVADGNVVADDARVEIVATRASRRGLIIQNADTTDTVWIGDSGVTTATGIELLPKQVIALNNYTGATASIYGICSAALTADVRFLEVY